MPIRLDFVDLLALSFLLIGGVLFTVGLTMDTRALDEFMQMFVDEWTPGFVIDGALLLVVNRIIRRNERNGVLAQVGSLSNEFALDAVRRARQQGWLMNGSLEGVTLKKAKLSGADLSGANLRNVDLRFADLRDVSLTHADLRGADLTGANLADADLRWAKFDRAVLRWCALEGVRLDGVEFGGADLEFASVDEDFARYVDSQDTIVGGHLKRTQVQVLRQTFDQIEKSGGEVVDLFYANLFAIEPDLKKMFSSSQARQSRKFLSSLRVIVHSLDVPEKSIEVLEQLGARHQSYGVKAEHYDLAGKVLIQTLAEFFGDRFTPVVREAWSAGFGLIAAVMVR
jgi:hemoglobin-like flavoprotein